MQKKYNVVHQNEQDAVIDELEDITVIKTSQSWCANITKETLSLIKQLLCGLVLIIIGAIIFAVLSTHGLINIDVSIGHSDGANYNSPDSYHSFHGQTSTGNLITNLGGHGQDSIGFNSYGNGNGFSDDNMYQFHVDSAGQALEHVLSGNKTEEDIKKAKKKYRKLFRIIDTDNSGFLSLPEFIKYFMLRNQKDGTFELMDINDDTILSFREVVAVLRAMDGLFDDEDNEFGVPHFFRKIVKKLYDYDYTHGDDLWYEYAADVFFESYDKNYNGFITHYNFFESRAKFEFSMLDLNANDRVSIDEFMSQVFASPSIKKAQEFAVGLGKGHLDRFYDELVSLTEEDLLDIELSMCPNVIQPTFDVPSINSVRRRLGWADCAYCAAYMVGCAGAALVTAVVCCAGTGGTACAPCAIGTVGLCLAGLDDCVSCGQEIWDWLD